MDKLDDTWDGLPGLWGSVCLNILDDLKCPVSTPERQEAEEMLAHPEGTVLPLIADVLDVPLWLLIEKIKAVRVNV
jgi:hypothetical protein